MERHVITASTLVVVFMLFGGSGSLAEKLAPDQKAPPFAKGSGGLILKAPFEGGARAADVGQRRAQTTNRPPPIAASPAPSIQVDGVVREETEELKEVDGQLVRVVKGNFAYNSPEGLPIAVKYTADENGNRASFTFGTGKPSSGSRPSDGGSKFNKPGLTPGGPGATSLSGGENGSRGGRPAASGASAGGSGGRPAASGGSRSSGGDGQNGASTYLPPTTKVDRSYLPPN